MIEPETFEEKHRSIKAVEIIVAEYLDAISKFDRFNSAHEGLSIIEEEVDELRKEVYKQAGSRDPDRLIKEAKQVAAMGLRFIIDVGMPLAEKKVGCPTSFLNAADQFRNALYGKKTP